METLPVTLVTFLNARLDEDEAVAREATAGPWCIGEGAHDADVYTAYVGPHDGEWPQMVAGMDCCGGIYHQPDAVHLATIAAHRRIVWMHATPWLGMDECGICVDEYGGTIQDDGPPHEPYPCPTLRALASVYADHPDYRQEWDA
jgi:hypothetical protein